MRRAPALCLAAVLVAATGCASASAGDVEARVVEITTAANDRDADALRSAADDLVEDAEAQVAAGELSSAQAARLTELAEQLRADADLIDSDVIDAETARREAEQRASEEAAAREEAEQAAREAEDEAAREEAEEAAKEAEQERKKAEEERKKAEEERKEEEKEREKGEKKGEDEDDG